MENYEYSQNISRYQYTRCGRFFSYVDIFTRIFGIFTAIVMFGVGADHLAHSHIIGFPQIVASLAVGFLESAWAVTMFLLICNEDQPSRTFNQWRYIMAMDKWKKTVMYAFTSVLFFVYRYRLWLCPLAGAMLLCLAGLHAILTFKDKYQAKEDALLNNGHINREESPEGRDGLSIFMNSPFRATTSADNLSALDQDGILEL